VIPAAACIRAYAGCSSLHADCSNLHTSVVQHAAACCILHTGVMQDALRRYAGFIRSYAACIRAYEGCVRSYCSLHAGRHAACMQPACLPSVNPALRIAEIYMRDRLKWHRYSVDNISTLPPLRDQQTDRLYILHICDSAGRLEVDRCQLTIDYSRVSLTERINQRHTNTIRRPRHKTRTEMSIPAFLSNLLKFRGMQLRRKPLKVCFKCTTMLRECVKLSSICCCLVVA